MYDEIFSSFTTQLRHIREDKEQFHKPVLSLFLINKWLVSRLNYFVYESIWSEVSFLIERIEKAENGFFGIEDKAAQFPFIRLQNSKEPLPKVWQVFDRNGKPMTSKTIAGSHYHNDLIAYKAYGEFTEPVIKMFLSGENAVAELIRHIVSNANFSSAGMDILNSELQNIATSATST